MANESKVKLLYRALFERLAGASTREGSVIVDQIINPLTLVNTPLYDQMQIVLDQLSLPAAQRTSEGMDVVGARYLAARRQGARATAEVVAILARPETVAIPAGTQFSTEQGLVFATTISRRLAPSDLEERPDGLFQTPRLLVTAAREGAEYNVAAGTLTTTTLPAQSLVSVSNPTAATGGGSAESDQAFRERLREVITSRSAETPRGLRYLLRSLFPGGLSRFTFVRSGDEAMQRDKVPLILRTREVPLVIRTELFRTQEQVGDTDRVFASITATVNDEVATLQQSPVMAFAFNAEQNLFTGRQSIVSSSDDFIVQQVTGVGRFGEYVFCAISSKALRTLSDTAVAQLSQAFGLTRLGRPPELAEDIKADYYFFARRGDLSFVPRESYLVYDPSLPESVFGRVDIETTLYEQLGQEGQAQQPITFAGKIRGQQLPRSHRLGRRRTQEKLEAPIFGLEVSQDDYGLAGRPNLEGAKSETATLIDDRLERDKAVALDFPPELLVAPSGAAPVGSAAGAFVVQGSESNALVLAPGTIDPKSLLTPVGGAITTDLIVQPSQVEPVVAYRAGQGGGFIINTSFIRQGTGDLFITAFRSAGPLYARDGFGLRIRADRVELVDTIDSPSGSVTGVLASVSPTLVDGLVYEVEILVTEVEEAGGDLVTALAARVWERGQPKPVDPLLSIGAHRPFRLQASGTQGDTIIGVSATGQVQGSAFQLLGLEVANLQSDYAQLLAELDVRGQTGSLDIQITAGGAGYDNESLALINGFEVYVRNTLTEEWELLGQGRNLGGQFSTINVSQDLLPEYAEGGVMQLLLTSQFPNEGVAVNNRGAYIELDYLFAKSTANVRSTGGKVDLFLVSEPDETSRDERGDRLWWPVIDTNYLIESPSFSNTISARSLGGPVALIDRVVLVSDDGQEITPLEEGRDYRYFWANENVRGSMDEEVVVQFSALAQIAQVRVYARVYTRIPLIDSVLREGEDRKIDLDVLVRHKSAVFIDVTGRLDGVSPAQARRSLREYIFQYQDPALDTASLSGFLRRQGARQVPLFDGTNEDEAMRITARRINDSGTEDSEQTYSRLTRRPTEFFLPGTISLISV